MPVLCSQAVGVGFESLLCQFFVRLILNIFWCPKLVKHYWVPLRSFLHCDTNIFRRKIVIPPIMHKFFRYSDFFEALKWCPRNFSAVWDQKISTEIRDTPPFIHKNFRHQNFIENSRIPLRSFSALWDKNFSTEFSDIPFLCIKFCDTPIFLKHQTVPQRHFLVLCDKSSRGRNVIPPPSLMHEIWRYPKLSETLNGCPPNFSTLWHQKFPTEKRDTPYYT